MQSLNKGVYFLLLFVLVGLFWVVTSGKSVVEYSSKSLRFSLFVKNNSKRAVKKIEIFIAAPVSNGKSQILETYNFAEGESLTEQGHFKKIIDVIPPYSAAKLNFVISLKRSNQAVQELLSSNVDYLKDEPYLNLASKSVQSIAQNIKGDNTKATAQNIYHWIVNNISVGDYSEISKGAEYTLDAKAGDCTDMMYLFVALARANGISARGVSGLLVPNQYAVINATDFHDWAEFYDGKKWVLVDPQNKNFDSHYSNYIQLNMVSSGSVLHRFWVNNPSISIAFE